MNMIGDQVKIYRNIIGKMLIPFYYVKKIAIIFLGRVANFYFYTGECIAIYIMGCDRLRGNSIL